jgi:hypothetical protein
MRHGAGLSIERRACLRFDRRVKNYVFTRGPLPSAVPEGVDFVNEPIKAFGRRLRKKREKTSG